jgi:hypothetical protein
LQTPATPSDTRLFEESLKIVLDAAYNNLPIYAS